MVRVVAESIDGDACIVWRLAPGSDTESESPRGHLFALAQWFRDTSWTTHNLPLNYATGLAVCAKTPDLVNDVDHHVGVHSGDKFFQRTKMKQFCTVPVDFGKSWGAVNVYRRADVDISENEFGIVQQLAGFVPPLYRTIRDRASFRLMRSVNETLRKAEAEHTQPEETMKEVCDLVSETFRSLECSVFLENPGEQAGIFRCFGTTNQVFGDKEKYSPTESGLTPWVIANGKGVQIFDLRHFHKELKQIQQEYPGITWTDRQGVVERTGRDTATKGVPVSFMATPISIGPDVRGVIRCCMAVKPPYYFAERELQLLELVASRISQYWNHQLDIEESQSKVRLWESLAESVRDLNMYVHGEFSKPEPDKLSIYREALTSIQAVIPRVSGSRIRLVDKSTNELRDVAEGGGERTFPLTGPQTSVGAKVYRNRELELVRPEDEADYVSEFGESGCAVVSPIWSGKTPIGVLDIRSMPGVIFGVEAKSLVELWGRQLGLYAYLADSIAGLHQAQTNLKQSISQQSQAYVYLEHQLKGPLITALRRVQEGVASKRTQEAFEVDLLALRGQLRKAYRVGNSVELFATLAKGKSLPVTRTQLEKDKVARSLIEYCQDFKLASKNRGIRFHVFAEDLDVLDRYFVGADWALFEHAVNNVLENAFKYSHRGKSVDVSAWVGNAQWFNISVRNRGLPIDEEDASKCKGKEWRGKKAKLVTSEGAGIGLWIVDEIMKVHKGKLDVKPTANEVTEVTLWWPCQKISTS